MRNITIAGGLGRDAETRDAGQNRVTSFPVAVDVREGGQKSTMWFDASLWGKRGDALRQYLTKGTRVAVSGRLSTREHNGKTYLKVDADDVTILGGGQQSGGGSYGGQQDSGQQGGGYGGPADLGDEIPFFREWRV